MPIKLQSPRKAATKKPQPTELRVTLQYPPSANRYWRSRAVCIRGKWVVQTYVSTEAKQYKAAVRSLVSLVCRAPFTDEVCIDVKLFRPRKSGDIDNRIKVLFDAFNGVVYDDDKLIKKCQVERFEDKDNPRAEVIITRYFAAEKNN